MMVENKLAEQGITLPDPPAPVASYVPVRRVGNLLYLSGQGPILNGEQMYTGKLGAECTLEDGYQAARLCAVNLLAQLKKAVGDLDRVAQVVSLKGYVASTTEFYEQPAVVNGASDLLIQAFGEKGRHSRCALGTNVLPTNIPVEVELIVEIEKG